MGPRDEENDDLLAAAMSVADDADVRWGDVSGEPDAVAALKGIQALARQRRVAATQERPILSRWGHLAIIGQLESRTGITYAARDEALGREVILRTLGPLNGNAGLTQALLDVARRHTQVRHPNLATILGADYSNDFVGCWHERVQGSSLRQAVATASTLGIDAVVTLILDVSGAVAALHAAGLVNATDLCEQVILTGDRALLIPAVWQDTSPATAGTERDVFALGALFVRLVAGARDDDGQDGLALIARMQRARPDVPSAVAAVIERALAPGRQFEDARLFRAALAAAQADRPRSYEWVGAFAFTCLVIALLVWYSLVNP